MEESGAITRHCQGEAFKVQTQASVLLERRQSQSAVLRRQSQGDALRRPSTGDLLRRASHSTKAEPPNKADILKRSNKKFSVANAVAVVGVTKALLVGL